MGAFLNGKQLISGILIVATLSAGIAHADARPSHDKQQSEAKSTVLSALEEGAQFVVNHPHLSLFSAVAPYLIYNRAKFIAGAKYGSKLVPLSLATVLAISSLLPDAITNKKIEKENYALDTYQTIYLAPILEEILFRSIIQRFSMLPAYFFPILTEPLLFLNACAFGGIHAYNGHKGAYIQAINIALIEYTVGLTRQYSANGLAYTMGMHMANNVIGVLLSKLRF